MRILAGLLGCFFVLFLLLIVPAVADDVDKYIKDLKDPNSEVRWKAADVLSNLNDTRAVEPLIQALKDGVPLVREEAAMALGHLNDTRAVDPLIQAFKDEDYHVRCSAATALSDLNDTRAVEPLIQALKEEDDIVRACTAGALGHLNDTRAVDPLIQVLKDEYWDARLSAAWALGDLKDTRAVEPLIQALKDERWDVRQGAAWSLGELGDSRAIEPLIQALKDEESSVQKTARDALEKLGWREGLVSTKRIAPENFSAGQSCDWSGWWETSAGDMQLKQSGGIVTGTFGGWTGSIKGNTSENMLKGRWSQISGGGAKYEGDLEFNMSEDCKSFSGRSRSYWDWGNWTGTRLLKRVVSEQFIANQRFGYPSPDYTKIEYTNSTPEGWAVVVAGPEGKSEGKQYKDLFREYSKRFSPDSRRFAYWTKVGDKSVAVVDGVEGKAYDEIENWALTFSPDSKHVAYRAKACDNNTCKWLMVLDGVEQPYYGNVDSNPVFSFPESGTGTTHLAYSISTDKGNYVVFDGKKLEPKGFSPVFSPDGKRLAYEWGTAMADDPLYIVLDGVSTGNLGEKPTSVWHIYAMYFSPDSKRFVYDACPNGRDSGAHVILSEKGRSSIYSGIGTVIFNPDSTRFAYKARNETTGLWEVVLDSEWEGKGYNDVSDPIFSPDSKHMAYIAKNDKGKFVVLDGNEGKNYSDVWALTFSPDSKRMAYVARDDKDGGKQFVVVDGQEGKRYSVEIKWGPFFSPDSKHVIYVTNNCYECSFKELVVVDEVEEKLPYDVAPFLGAGRIVFDSNSTFHYLAENAYQTYLIKERLGETEAALSGPVATGPQAASAYKDKLSGDWIMQGKQTGVENSDWKAVLTLKADGTLSWLQTEGANIGTIRTGTWEFDGTTITMKWSSPKGGQINWTSNSVSSDGISQGTYTAELVSGGTWSALRSAANVDEAEPKKALQSSSLLGDWKMEGSQTGVENSNWKAKLTLNSDGTLNWIETEGANVGATRSGTWDFDGKTLTLKWSSSKGGQITWISSSCSEDVISEGTYTAELVSGGTWSASR